MDADDGNKGQFALPHANDLSQSVDSSQQSALNESKDSTALAKKKKKDTPRSLGFRRYVALCARVVYYTGVICNKEAFRFVDGYLFSNLSIRQFFFLLLNKLINVFWRGPWANIGVVILSTNFLLVTGLLLHQVLGLIASKAVNVARHRADEFVNKNKLYSMQTFSRNGHGGSGGGYYSEAQFKNLTKPVEDYIYNALATYNAVVFVLAFLVLAVALYKLPLFLIRRLEVEHLSGFKEHLLVAGTSGLAYIASHFIVDCMVAFIVVLSVVATLTPLPLLVEWIS